MLSAEPIKFASVRIRPILEVNKLSISFTQYTSGLRRRDLTVITDLNVSVKTGEVLAVVGSSGSGKSLLAHAILGILPSNAKVSGLIQYNGKEITLEQQMALRGQDIALVPQSVNFLDPLMRVGRQVQNAVKEGDPTSVQRKVFERFKLGEKVAKLFPFQISGGMARRVLVSTAVVSGARLVIADEPTPGLDEKSIEKTLKHFRQLADEGCAVMLITHDIESALKISDRIAVFYAGTTVEIANAKDFSDKGEKLRHPYSKALWKALPQNGFTPIPGTQPLANELPPGCVFQPRCNLATAECGVRQPEMRVIRSGDVRCINAS